jgi:hypothetical protein
MKILLKILAPLSLCQIFFGSSQTLPHRFQVVISFTKFDEHFTQSNQVLNLIAQSPPMLAAQFVKFSPLFFGHTDVKAEIFLCHSFNIAKAAL